MASPSQYLSLAKAINDDIGSLQLPPDDGGKPKSHDVLAFSIVKGTRPYIERTVNQINGAYEHGYFDASAVMIRRLVETLIIEAFEAHGFSKKIKNHADDFFMLKDLIAKTLNEPSWNLGRSTKRGLSNLKDVGDKSAHNRRFNAHRKDIDDLKSDIRAVAQELIYLSSLKK